MCPGSLHGVNPPLPWGQGPRGWAGGRVGGCQVEGVALGRTGRGAAVGSGAQRAGEPRAPGRAARGRDAGAGPSLHGRQGRPNPLPPDWGLRWRWAWAAGGPSGASHRGLKQQRFASHGSGGQMSRAEADRPLAPKAPDLPSASGGCRCDPGWAPSGLRLPAAPPVPLGQRSPTWLVTAAKLSCFQRRPLPGTRCSGAFLF